MKIEHRIIDDLKTERPDVTPCLPTYFQLVPILFYVVVIGGILLSAVFFLLLRNATFAEVSWNNENAQLKQSLTAMQGERELIEQQTQRANSVVSWVEGARNIQPLVVAIIRNIEEGSSIAELGLTRDQDTPTHLKLKIKLNTLGLRQLDAILEKIASFNFKTYNPNQTQSKGEIDYEATLIYQNTSEPQATPNIDKHP
ncbi:MAG: hypothetical protein ABI443_09905 [Chthoniobacterales bacterium]